MTTWASYLDRLEATLDHTERCLAAGDLDAACLALATLVGGPAVELPSLPVEMTTRASRCLARMDALETAASDALARLRPELALLAGAATAGPATALFLDQSA